METRIDRRKFLKLGVTVAGVAVSQTTLSGCVRGFGGDGRDHATAAQGAYRRSLTALSRSAVTPGGTERTETGLDRLALAPEALLTHRGSRPGRPDFDVLIIGSGYGGAVCAARLSACRRRGVKIGLVERGLEWVPGTFPDRLARFRVFNRTPTYLNQELDRNPHGLFGLYSKGDVSVAVGSGLGGGSLINCAVVIETEDAVFETTAWPAELRSKKRLHPYYTMARRMLDPQTTPTDRYPPKLKNHLGTAAALKQRGVWNAEAYPAPIAVTFASRRNAQGMQQHGCVQCGDCSTGCNVGAKNSLDMNYLPLAWALGVSMFTQIDVERIEREPDGYRVHYVRRSGDFLGLVGRGEPGFVTARSVILAAGTMGTNEILLRSRTTNGLAVSDWLGKGFSGNGNYLGFVDYQYVEQRVTTRSAGVGVAGGTPREPVGPTIQGIIDFRRPDRPMVRRVIMEDLAHPSALARGIALMTRADLDRAITLLVCAHDTADGEIRLEDDTAVVHWPRYATQPCHAETVALIEQYASAQAGRPGQFTPGANTTAHPLGGCRMGANAREGVVNHRGEVFAASPGRDAPRVHPGLYVADASIIPTALGNNPLLTITALAERLADLLVRDPKNSAFFDPTRAVPAG
jgi:cholesterol oxidase